MICEHGSFFLGKRKKKYLFSFGKQVALPFASLFLPCGVPVQHAQISLEILSNVLGNFVVLLSCFLMF